MGISMGHGLHGFTDISLQHFNGPNRLSPLANVFPPPEGLACPRNPWLRSSAKAWSGEEFKGFLFVVQ